MSRTHFAARGALALGSLWAMAACDNGSNNIILPRPVSPIFTSYVAMGNSLTAGFQSGGINDSTQKQSYALLLARSMGTRYAYPGLAMPGCPPPIANFQTQAVVGQPPATNQTCNFRTQISITTALNNVAVPGVASADPDVQTPPAQQKNPLEQIILGGKSMVQRALDVHPTFATVWIGNNDILSPAIQGLSQFATQQPTPQATFVQNYSKMIGDLLAGAPGLKGVLIGVVQVANAPVMFTSQALLNPAFVAGLSQAAGQTLLIDANTCTPSNQSLIGLPLIAQIRAKVLPPIISCAKTNTPPLGDLFVLDPAEQAQVKAIVDGYNGYIKAKADSIGFAYYDPNTTLARLATQDPVLATHVPNLASATATFGQFVTLDGIHPSGAAHIQIANDLITVINTKYGTSLPPAG
jgi:lysophospholipase L1-like esterase